LNIIYWKNIQYSTYNFQYSIGRLIVPEAVSVLGFLPAIANGGENCRHFKLKIEYCPDFIRRALNIDLLNTQLKNKNANSTL
jgi:hypothetical protein